MATVYICLSDTDDGNVEATLAFNPSLPANPEIDNTTPAQHMAARMMGVAHREFGLLINEPAQPQTNT